MAAIQFRSRGKWRNLPYFAISQAFRHREVQKDGQNRKREKREKAVNVSLFTVGHVFVGFVERVGSGIRNAEFATLFFCYLWKIT